MSLHKLNPHQGQYDLDGLAQLQPDLKKYFKTRPDGEITLDFSSDDAVKLLNKSLLQSFYKVEHWDIPPGYLCPPVPGRADYICRLTDLLGEKAQKGKQVRGLDIGTGANLIYPIVGSQLFNWKFVGAELDSTAFNTAKALVDLNKNLKPYIQVRRQTESDHIFKGIIQKNDYFDFTLCNPPFHASAEEAQAGTQRKWKNLKQGSKQSQKLGPKQEKAKQAHSNSQLNFGGQSNELWCDGGEAAFIRRMIDESIQFQDQVHWFTTLVSKKENLPAIYKQLKKAKAKDVKTFSMSQGNKQTRFVAWTFS